MCCQHIVVRGDRGGGVRAALCKQNKGQQCITVTQVVLLQTASLYSSDDKQPLLPKPVSAELLSPRYTTKSMLTIAWAAKTDWIPFCKQQPFVLRRATEQSTATRIARHDARGTQVGLCVPEAPHANELRLKLLQWARVAALQAR